MRKIAADWKEVGRLAMRVEGDNWNAYYALPGTMKGAILLGSIRMKFVQEKARRDIFLAFMRECVADILEENFGSRPRWGGEHTAPEHERTRE